MSLEYTHVSSVNRTDMSLSEAFGDSLIYIKNNSPPRTDPSGTLISIFLHSYLQPSIRAHALPVTEVTPEPI